MSAIVIAIVVSVAAVVGYGSYLIFGPDNQVEEVCEEIIKVETGETVDLSPNETTVSEKSPSTTSLDLASSSGGSQEKGANGPSETPKTT